MAAYNPNLLCAFFLSLVTSSLDSERSKVSWFSKSKNSQHRLQVYILNIPSIVWSNPRNLSNPFSKTLMVKNEVRRCWNDAGVANYCLSSGHVLVKPRDWILKVFRIFLRNIFLAILFFNDLSILVLDKSARQEWNGPNQYTLALVIKQALRDVHDHIGNAARECN